MQKSKAAINTLSIGSPVDNRSLNEPSTGQNKSGKTVVLSNVNRALP
ncbi:hypothetical protein AFEL58S_00266 [Afipia felis]